MKKTDLIKKELEKILSLMKIKAEIKTSEEKDFLYFNIFPQEEVDIKLLVGWHGRNLSALQNLLKIILNKKLEKETIPPFVLDVADYWQKKEKNLVSLAQEAAEKVKSNQREMVLDPMSPRERRIIHLTLSKISGVTSESIGEGKERRVVIKLADKE